MVVYVATWFIGSRRRHLSEQKTVHSVLWAENSAVGWDFLFPDCTHWDTGCNWEILLLFRLVKSYWIDLSNLLNVVEKWIRGTIASSFYFKNVLSFFLIFIFYFSSLTIPKTKKYIKRNLKNIFLWLCKK